MAQSSCADRLPKAESVLRIDPTRRQVTFLRPHERVGALNKYEGGALGANGSLYCLPLNAKKVLKLTPAQRLQPGRPGSTS